MLVAMSRAYSCGRGLQKIFAANAVSHVLGNRSDENRLREGVELNRATAAGVRDCYGIHVREGKS
jgi:hypothetical protein